ncbi:MAG: hypothetical protein J5857_07195, partial [Treponema sp.]|nr:hypothetical protein [Treponema sp.]
MKKLPLFLFAVMFSILTTACEKYQYHPNGQPAYRKFNDGHEEWYDKQGWLTQVKHKYIQKWYDEEGLYRAEWYDERGTVIEFIKKAVSTDNKEFLSVSGVDTDDFGLHYITGYNNFNCYYDDNNKIILQVRYRDDGKQEDSYKTSYKYDENGNIKNITEIDEKGKIISFRQYDDYGNLVHRYLDFRGPEYWRDYDSRGNLVHEKNSRGYEAWYDYDSRDNFVHEKNSRGYEAWYDYDSRDNLVH